MYRVFWFDWCHSSILNPPFDRTPPWTHWLKEMWCMWCSDFCWYRSLIINPSFWQHWLKEMWCMWCSDFCWYRSLIINPSFWQNTLWMHWLKEMWCIWCSDFIGVDRSWFLSILWQTPLWMHWLNEMWCVGCSASCWCHSFMFHHSFWQNTPVNAFIKWDVLCRVFRLAVGVIRSCFIIHFGRTPLWMHLLNEMWYAGCFG